MEQRQKKVEAEHTAWPESCAQQGLVQYKHHISPAAAAATSSSVPQLELRPLNAATSHLLKKPTMTERQSDGALELKLTELN